MCVCACACVRVCLRMRVVGEGRCIKFNKPQHRLNSGPDYVGSGHDLCVLDEF